MKKTLFLFILVLSSISIVFGGLNNSDLYYSFDVSDLTGSNPDDLSPSGYDGTNNGATTGVSGILNTSFDYDGSADYVTTSQTIFNTSNGTISFWFYADNISNTAFLAGDRSASGEYLQIFTQGSNLDVRINDGSNHDLSGTFTLANGQWYHLIFTWGSSGMKSYINGTMDASNAYTGAWASNSNMEIGRVAAFAGTNNFDGKIDEFAIWDRQLNTTEIAELYNNGTGYNFYDVTPAPISEAFLDIDFLGESIVNNTLTNNNNVYWNLLLNDSISLTNFSVDFNGTGFEKIIDLPFGNKILSDYNRTSSQDQLNGFIRYNNTIYMTAADNVNKDYNQIIKITSDYANVIEEINITSLPTPSGSSSSHLRDITVKDNNFYLLQNNGLIHKFSNQLVDLNESYNLSNLGGGLSLSGKVQGIFFDEETNRWIHSVGSDRKWYLYNEDFTQYLGEVNVSNDPPLNVEINRYTTPYDGKYYMYGNNKVFELYTNFTYTGNTYTVLDFLESDTCSSVFQGSFRFQNGEFIGLCWSEKVSSKVQFQRFNRTLDFIENNYTVSYGKNNLDDGTYTIRFRTENATSVYNTSTYTFSIDNTEPIINNSLPSQINSYLINISNYVTCTDASSLQVCNITFQPDNNTILVNQSSLYNFTYNGNQSYTISAKDSAGNTITENGTILVNPYQYFRFNHSGSYLTNYTFGGTFWTGDYANFTIYNDVLSIGNNSLQFSKLGYITQTFTELITNTSRINKTYNVSQAEIQVTIRDKDTLTQINGVTFNLDFIGNTGFNTTTSTGNKTITGLLTAGSYELIVSGSGYTTESNFFTFTNQELLELTVYVANSTTNGFVIIEGTGTNGELAVGAIAQALQWNGVSYIVVSEGTTDSSGKATLNVILNTKSYKFKLIEGSNSITSPAETITNDENGKTVPLSLQTGSITYNAIIDNYLINSTETYNNLTNISNIVMDYSTVDGTNMIACINVYTILNDVERLSQSFCSNASASGQMSKNFLINSSQTTNIKTELLLGGNYYTYEIYKYFPTLSFQNALLTYGFYFFVMLLLYLLSIWAGIQLFDNIYIAIMLVIVSGFIGYNLVPSIMTNLVATSFALMGSLTIWGGYRRK